MENVNKGHRERLRARFVREGLDNFQDHEVLELLLFQSIPRKDTNKIAHELLNTFGSLANVLDATEEQLTSVKGISEVTAVNLAVLKCVWQRYKQSSLEKIPLEGLASIIRYSRTLISDNFAEKLVAVFVDNATNYISKAVYCSDDTQKVHVGTKSIVAAAMKANAAGVIIFHCHVKGLCEPSDDDIAFTEKLYIALASLNMVLLEHMIFNGSNEYFSFYQEGLIKKCAAKYNALST